MQQMSAHGHAPLPPIAELRPDLPGEVVSVLERMLAKDRNDRFSDPADVAAALAPYTADCDLAEFVKTTRRTTTSKLDLSRVSSLRNSKQKTALEKTKNVSRRTLAIGAATLFCGLAGGFLGVVFGPWKHKGSEAPPDRAGTQAVGSALSPLPGAPIKIGILHSVTGTMAISERPVIDATLMAIDEINQAGGLLGRTIEALIEDGESDNQTFAAKAEKLITKDRVCTVFGCWTSASRKTVLPLFENHNHLLFYPVQYEGLEQSPNIVYTGAAANQQIIPAIKWCVTVLKAKKFFLVGSDHVFPRAANAIIRDQATNLGAEIVGEEYLPLGSSDALEIVRKIASARADAILNTINGDSNVAFFRSLRASGSRRTRPRRSRSAFRRSSFRA